MIAIENATERQRGELTRWLLELKPGVFVGNVNTKIRDLLWDRLCVNGDSNGALLVFPTNNEQGYSFRLAGTPKRKIVDLDGLELIKIE